MGSRIMDACHLLKSDYITPFFLENEHVETILGAKLRQNPHVDYYRQCVKTDDGGVFTMDWDREVGAAVGGETEKKKKKMIGGNL